MVRMLILLIPVVYIAGVFFTKDWLWFIPKKGEKKRDKTFPDRECRDCGKSIAEVDYYFMAESRKTNYDTTKCPHCGSGNIKRVHAQRYVEEK